MSTSKELVKTYRLQLIAVARDSSQLRLTEISCQLTAEKEQAKRSGTVHRLGAVEKELVDHLLPRVYVER